jgi:transposase
MSRKRKQYSSEFKAKVALSPLKNKETVAQLAAQYEVQR